MTVKVKNIKTGEIFEVPSPIYEQVLSRQGAYALVDFSEGNPLVTVENIKNGKTIRVPQSTWKQVLQIQGRYKLVEKGVEKIKEPVPVETKKKSAKKSAPKKTKTISYLGMGGHLRSDLQPLLALADKKSAAEGWTEILGSSEGFDKYWAEANPE